MLTIGLNISLNYLIRYHFILYSIIIIIGIVSMGI
jgi:hypothetical protein